jgi:outer membrane protein
MRQGLIAFLCGAIAPLVFTGASHAQNIDQPILIGPTEQQGVSLGIRGAYGIPFGSTLDGEKLSSDLGGMIPLWLDVGYRFSHNWYLGGFFSYGFGFVPSNKPECSAPTSCSGNVLRLGINFHYHLNPMRAWDPWIGLGAAYEIFNFDAIRGGQSSSPSFTGFEFGNAQLGVDYRVSSQFVVGPFVAFTVGQYSTVRGSGAASSNLDITSKAIHEWLMFGVRGVFTLLVD